MNAQAETASDVIASRPSPFCALCGDRGEPLYDGLTDRIFGAPGAWDLKKCSRAGCGLIWLDPVPVEDQIGRAYRVYYTHEGAPRRRGLMRAYEAVKQGHIQTMGYRDGAGPSWYRRLAPLARLHPGGTEEIEAEVSYLGAPPAGGKVLDVGCGGGVLLARLRDLGWEVSGVDYDSKAVAEARSKGLDVTLGELTDRTDPDDSFDAIALGHVVEHVYDPVALLDRCRRLLKPGGRLVVLTPNSASWGHRHFGVDWRGLEPPRHIHIFNSETLETVARRAGFSSVEVRTLYRGARTILAVSAMLRSGRPLNECRGPVWKLRGILYQLRERLAMRADPRAGEELLGIATKT